MLLNYSNFDFINEEIKIADIKVGDKIIFTANVSILDCLTKLKGKTGVVKKILVDNSSYYSQKEIKVELDEPVEIKKIVYQRGYVESSPDLKKMLPYYWQRYDHRVEIEKVKEISLVPGQLNFVEILTSDYLDIKKRVESGELIPYTASQIFKSVLKSIKFEVKEKYLDITSIDIQKEDPTTYVTFIPARRVKAEDKERYRQSSRVGRVLRKLNKDYSEADIEKLVDLYRARMDELLKEKKVKIVKGEEIAYWYDESRYKSGGGSLNNSCMRYKGLRSRIQRTYGNNPDKIALAVLIENDELVARALVWNLDDGRIYMDRIYSINGAKTQIMKNFALKNGWLTYNGDDRRKIKSTTVTLKNSVPADHPYFDTFYVKSTNVLGVL